METIKNNSEILLIYDAQYTNPNGDPDEENKPRFDYKRQRVLVSDLRLKRYIRDYLEQNGFDIFVTEINNEPVKPFKRIEALTEKYGKNLKNFDKNDFKQWLLNKLIDIRYFGAMIPIDEKGFNNLGSNIIYTGAVQFSWGYSLNKLDDIMTNTITTKFSGATSGERNIGKDYRIDYALISFYGLISLNRAKFTNLSEDDVKLFDYLILRSLMSETTTRSKIGQLPLVYIRVQYKDNEDIFLGDLRRFVKIDLSDSAIEYGNYKIDLEELKQFLEKHSEKINNLFFWVYDQNLLKEKFSSEKFKLTFFNPFDDNFKNLLEKVKQNSKND